MRSWLGGDGPADRDPGVGWYKPRYEFWQFSDPEAVFEDLGDKVVEGLGKAVALTRRDLATYRRAVPVLVSRHSPSGLAHWIQDQLWFHVVAELGPISSVAIREAGVTREIFVGSNYRFRIKRHHLADSSVATYPTHAALDFLAQPEGQLPGMESVHLIAGYAWDREDNSMSSHAVVSLRDGKDEVIWTENLPIVALDAEDVANVVTPERDGPLGPTIAFPGDGESGESGADTGTST